MDVSNQKPQIVWFDQMVLEKTTTPAKLAYFYKTSDKEVILVFWGTFGPPENEQLNSWELKLSIDVVLSQHGAYPAAVDFYAYIEEISRKKDILCIDNGGRFHIKSNLMKELQIILRVLKKLIPIWFPMSCLF